MVLTLPFVASSAICCKTYPPRNLVEEYEERLSNFLEPVILRHVDSMMRKEEQNATLPSIMAALEQFSADRQSAPRVGFELLQVASGATWQYEHFRVGDYKPNVMPSSAFSINYNSQSGFIGDVHLSSTPGFPPRNLVEEYEERLSNFLEPVILGHVDSMMREEEHNATLPSIMAALEQFNADRQSAPRVTFVLLQVASGATWQYERNTGIAITLFSSVSSSSNVGTNTSELGITSQNVISSSPITINYNSQSGFIGDVHLSSTLGFFPRNLVEDYEERLSNFFEPVILRPIDSTMREEEHNSTLPSIMAALEQFSADQQSAPRKLLLNFHKWLMEPPSSMSFQRTDPGAEQNILFSSVSFSSNVGTSTSELGITSQNVMTSSAFSINYNSQSGFIGDVHLSSTPRFLPRNLVEEYEERLSNFLEPVILRPVDSMMREEDHNATLLQLWLHWSNSVLIGIVLYGVAFELLLRTDPGVEQNILFSSISSSSNVGTSTSKLGITSQNVMPSSAFSINYNSQSGFIGDVHLSSTPGFLPRNLVQEYEERLSNFLEPVVLRPVDSMMREEHNATLPSIVAALEQFSTDRQSAPWSLAFNSYKRLVKPPGRMSVSSSSNVGTSTSELGITSQNVMPSSAFSINYNSQSGFIGDVHLSSTSGFPSRNRVQEYEERLSNFLEPIILRPVDSMMRQEEHNATLPSIMAVLGQFSADRQSALR
ncbi:unnamed protein product [Camellia sinensis]